jgi:hypothetical protein
MNHRLKFVKISPDHGVAGVGFGGNIFIVLNTLSFVGDSERLYVDMSNDCICNEKDAYLYDTNNCWEYYFEQIKLKDNEIVNEMDSLIRGNLVYEDRDAYLYPDNFLELKKKFNDNFKLKPYLSTIIEDFYNKNIKDKLTLGVHIRLTDMRYNFNTASFESYVQRINQILTDKPEIEQIFIASDDSLAISRLEKLVNVPVISHVGMFRADTDSPHNYGDERLDSNRDLHRYNIGLECVKEIFTLSKCDYLLKADLSSLSIVASILNENNKQIYKV